MDYAFGRIEHHDPRNRGFAALAAPAMPPKAKLPGRAWYTTDVYEQSGPSCTAQSAVGLLRTSPSMWPLRSEVFSRYDTEAERHMLYREAQKHDPWEGEHYAGTSTDAPFKVLRLRGEIAEWRWLFGEEELREWLTWYGPAVVGTQWHQEMLEPDADGFIYPRGRAVGGHAYRIVQFSLSRDAYRIVNSWGREWGQQGRAWIERSAMAHLLSNGGECVTVPR